MAHILHSIWKSAQGLFFETELEALQAERDAALAEVWCEAQKEALKPHQEAYEQAFELWQQVRRDDPRNASGMSPPRKPSHEYHIPPKMFELVVMGLEGKGLLVPLKAPSE